MGNAERRASEAAYIVQLHSLEREDPNARSYITPYEELSDQAREVYDIQAELMNPKQVAAESEGAK